MNAELPRDVWVPVALRWRHVIPGDLFIGGTGAPWLVVSVDREPSGNLLAVAMRHDGPRKADVDPDDTVQVLVPVAEREAATVARELLGARLIERRSAA